MKILVGVSVFVQCCVPQKQGQKKNSDFWSLLAVLNTTAVFKRTKQNFFVKSTRSRRFYLTSIIHGEVPGLFTAN